MAAEYPSVVTLDPQNTGNDGTPDPLKAQAANHNKLDENIQAIANDLKAAFDSESVADIAAAFAKFRADINTSIGVLQFFADQFDNPVNIDWAVNALAPAIVDSNDNNKIVRAFDDITEEGVGWVIRIPLAVTNIILKFVSRAETAPPATRTVGLKLYQQGNPDNAVPDAWDAGTVLTDIDIPTNENFQYDSQTLTLVSLGLVAGEVTHFELTRVNPAGGTELVGDWNLLELEVSFS